MNVDSTDVISHIYFEVDSDIYNAQNKTTGGYSNGTDSEYLNTESMLGGNERQYLDHVFSGGAMDVESMKQALMAKIAELKQKIMDIKNAKKIVGGNPEPIPTEAVPVIDTIQAEIANLETQAKTIASSEEGQKVQEKISNVQTKIKSLGEKLTEKGFSIVGYVSNIASNVGKTVSDVASDVFSGVSKLASNVFNTAKSVIPGQQTQQGGASGIDTEQAENELMQIIENARSKYNTNAKVVGGNDSESSVSLSASASASQTSEVSTRGGRVNIVFNVSQKAVREMKKSVADVKHTTWMGIVSPIIKKARENLDLEGDKLTESKQDTLHKEVMNIFNKIKSKIDAKTTKADVEKMV